MKEWQTARETREETMKEKERIVALLIPFGATAINFGLVTFVGCKLIASTSGSVSGTTIEIRVYSAFHPSLFLFSREYKFDTFSENDAEALFSAVYEACLEEETGGKCGK